MLQASNKAAGGETARHQDTRAVSGGTPAAKLITHRKYKRFHNRPIKDTAKSRSKTFADSYILFHLFANFSVILVSPLK